MLNLEFQIEDNIPLDNIKAGSKHNPLYSIIVTTVGKLTKGQSFFISKKDLIDNTSLMFIDAKSRNAVSNMIGNRVGAILKKAEDNPTDQELVAEASNFRDIKFTVRIQKDANEEPTGLRVWRTV